MKLPKKYIKKYGLTKKAWSEFKKARKKASRKIKRVAKKITRKVKRKVSRKKGRSLTYKKGTRTMAKRRKRSVAKKPRRRRATLLTNRTMNAVINGGIIGGTAIGSTWVVNMIPMVKDQASWIKALVQAGIGVAGLTFSKDLMVKKAFSGCIAGGAITLILPFMPETFRFAGNGRPLTTPELRELQMGQSHAKVVRAGKPVSVAMGKPVSLGYARGNRGYTKAF